METSLSMLKSSDTEESPFYKTQKCYLKTGNLLQTLQTSLDSSVKSESLCISHRNNQNKKRERDESSVSTSGNEQQSEMLSKRHRLNRNKYEPRLNLFPRILKRDIRRSYASMLVNVMNSFDVEMMVKFFSAFCLRSCYLFDDSTEALAVEPVRPVNSVFRRVRGPEHIALHLLRGMDLVPDCIIRLIGAEILQTANHSGSKIVCRVQIDGTKLFTYAVATSDNHQTVLYEAETQAAVFQRLRLLGGAAAALRMQDITQYFQKIASHQPLSVQFMATITLHLDEENRIYRLDFHNSLDASSIGNYIAWKS